jgi:hypothetical protein
MRPRCSIFLCCIPFVLAATPSHGQEIGVPPYLWVSSYGTDTYLDGGPGTRNSEITAREFFTQLQAKVTASRYSSSINLRNYIERQGKADTVSNFLNDARHSAEFLVVAGHGDPGYWYFYDTNIPTRVDTKPVGGWTKWIFTFACNLMQFDGRDPDVRTYFDNAFGGAHGFFGFGSVVWGSYDWNCGFLWLKTCHRDPSRLWDEFFQRWVINKESMVNAWMTAVWNKLYKDMHYPGAVPVAYGTEVLVNGQYLSGISETIDQVYNWEMPRPGTYPGRRGVLRKDIYGSPQY